MAHTARRPAGYITITDPDAPLIEMDTHWCVHCGNHFPVVHGSGIERGYCMNCAGVTCGSPQCVRCVPLEAWLEAVEAKATRHLRGY